MSAVWQYFTVDFPTSKTAKCNICKEAISRGGTNVANFNTSNLIKHLKTRHTKEHDEFTKAKGKKKDELQQQTLETAFQRRDKFTKDSQKATKITDKIVEFIVLDDQPLSVVENVGFRRLMEHLEPRYCLPGRKYISETALPKLYETVREHILCMLKDVHAISFTTDIWSSDVCPMSLLSLTSHWVDRESTFTPRSAVLHANEFRGSHTGTSIAEAIEEMLVKWKIPKSNVHVVLRDNASNMKKAMDEMDVASLGCFAHTLQLVVHEGLLSQRSVSDALANGRKIVGHFKHSPLATTRLEEIQKDLQMPTKRLHQDVATRWNSTYYMLESLLEQKRSISAYGADHDLPVTLTSYQWALLEKIIIVLAPFEELTRQISSSTSSAAEVIPSVTVLKRLLARENEGDTGIKTMKTTLLEAVQKRFKTIENEPLYAVATLLDPRFKDRYFTGADSNKNAKDALTQEVEKMEAALLSRTTPKGAETVPENPHKAPRLEAQPDSSSSRKSSLKGLFEEILQEHDEERGASSTSTQVQNQIQTYLTEQTVPRSDSPFQYWGVNQIRFPTLAATAAKFLCAPCTSVDSERLFSVASNIIDARRNRLGGERAEMLIFLKKNLPLLLKL
ncbi:zinc finger BED domain-containing protein 4-like [Carassius gibelio]|uniref:zinc finger BED domain-containing protein 4-like n=1 Tax=Carassius gibelio TaxID=101364 RepID=UPI0022782BA0|nr:zinc finger BED domain-containing protein 4-like [Carassius gibelio]XP_052447772.1 zinc finger BED domain-containing protein 4-like [Carassius gibelio]